MAGRNRYGIVHVVSSVARESSGPSYSVVRLCETLLAQGEHVTLATLDAGVQTELPPFVHPFPRGGGPRRLGRSPALKRWLEQQAATDRVAVIHGHGLWKMNAVYPAWAVRKGRAKLMTSPRGTLSPWAMRFGSPAKRLFWPLLQRPALERAACFHATAESEYEDIRRLGFRQPVAVIPNGVDLPGCEPTPRGAIDDTGEEGRSTLLYLARIHPKKGLATLLGAWRAVQQRFPCWRLVVAGAEATGARGHLAAMQRHAADLGAVRVQFVGELRGRAKWDAYRRAALYVLPSYSENFGMTVAEALAAGTPVIVTRATPWQEVETVGAGWWIDAGVAALSASLRTALAAGEDELRRMGGRGRRWMRTAFAWPPIAARMARTYAWLRDERRAAPDWVRLD